jgi:hypothetical protein
MRRVTRLLASVVTLLMLALGLTVTLTGTASATPSIPTLQWANAPVNANPIYGNIVTSPAGNVTVGCNTGSPGQDLVTYGPTGAVISQISRATQIDGVANCISNVVVDKNGSTYGIPWGPAAAGGSAFGPNLLAYNGNTLNWKYPVHCATDQSSHTVLSADGNIYATVYGGDGVHVIGLAPKLASGATVPTKVLDIKLPSALGCSTMIYAYKDGLMVHAQLSGNAQYYSYSGKYLGTASIGDVWYEKLNADGRLFVSGSTVSGNGHSVSVSAYDPQTAQVAWTATASTPGADTKYAQLYPTLGGGVIALVSEQRMLASGVPASPTEWVYTVTSLNSSGIKLWSTQLPNQYTDTQGKINYYENGPQIVTDVSGKVAMVRHVLQPTNVSYPTTEYAIEIKVADAATGTITYANIMQGNTDHSVGSLYGYSLFYGGSNGPVTGTDTLFIQAHCSGNCSDGGTKMYPIKVPGLGMDYPRGAILTPRPPAVYKAYGDSFSSGESLPPFAAGTDLPGVNLCHRSNLAYPSLIAGTSAKIPSLGTTGFRACSNAVASNVWDVAQWNEGTQTGPTPDSTTTLVTMTIGGNDIGFADFGKACVLGVCDPGSAAYNVATNHINNDLAAQLTAAYQNILTMAPNAKIYVLGYPHVAPIKKTGDSLLAGASCGYLYKGTLHWGNAQGARDVVTMLDQKISDTVTKVINNPRLHYVPVNASNSPFVGHEVCGTSGTSWFQNVDRASQDKAYVFHPNALGQQGGYAMIAKLAINAG